MMAFILATDFDFIAYMSKMAFFGSFFHANGVFAIRLIYPIHLPRNKKSGLPPSASCPVDRNVMTKGVFLWYPFQRDVHL